MINETTDSTEPKPRPEPSPAAIAAREEIMAALKVRGYLRGRVLGELNSLAATIDRILASVEHGA